MSELPSSEQHCKVCDAVMERQQYPDPNGYAVARYKFVCPKCPITSKDVVHELKVATEFFNAVESGQKPFEIRKGDRPFKVGDTLWLREVDIVLAHTGREARKRITFVLRGWGMESGYVGLGLAPIQPVETKPPLGQEPWRCSLPVITVQMLADFGQEGFFQKTDQPVHGVAGVSWSQAAVDFSCLIQGLRKDRPAVEPSAPTGEDHFLQCTNCKALQGTPLRSDGTISLLPFEGWTFSTTRGWRCPNCDEPQPEHRCDCGRTMALLGEDQWKCACGNSLTIKRAEKVSELKVGCNNYRFSGGEYCANCGFHLREHVNGGPEHA